MTSASASARYNSPFTATQWQELEHQALVYKYMVLGVPVPPDLIYNIRRSLDSSLSSWLLGQQSVRWEGCFQIGYGRKADPEPWRCRRTDGKKWRCSKQAHPDSKYCEKHMHRGKNRSRKPVEVSSTSRTQNPSPYMSNFPLTSLPYPLIQPHSSSSKTLESVLSPQKHTTHQLFLDSGNSSCLQDDKDYREAMKKEDFSKETSGSGTSRLSSSFEPLRSPYYCQSELQNFNINSKNQQEEQSYFGFGNEFKSSKPAKTDNEDSTQKPLHHFFGQWHPKDTDSWL